MDYNTEIYLRNGQILKVNTTKWSLERDYLGNISVFNWSKAEHGRILNSIQPEEIVAIIDLVQETKKKAPIKTKLKNDKEAVEGLTQLKNASTKPKDM